MASTTSGKKGTFFSNLLITLAFFVALYFVLTVAINYFVLTEETYGSYFWPRLNWVLPHVICGVIAILIGPFQFSTKLRAKNTQLHRRMGYVYLFSILVGGVAGIGLALTSKVNITYMMGLFFLAIAWLLTSGMAFFFILKRKTTQHKEWMIRSYVVTFAFVFFRLVNDLLKYYEIGDGADRNALMSWACWAVPLLFTEAILQYRKTFKHRKKS